MWVSGRALKLAVTGCNDRPQARVFWAFLTGRR